MLQELIEAEATARIGAEWNEHTDTRTTFRNGHRDKTLSTQAGDLDLSIPKLRSVSFFPVLLERRRRIDQALYAVIMEAYVHGVSTQRHWKKIQSTNPLERINREVKRRADVVQVVPNDDAQCGW